jgi:hypothetical protein
MSYEKAIALMEKGPSKLSLYSVRIGGGKVTDDVNDYLDFFCFATTIPSISAQTVAAVGQEHQGVYRETPAGIMFSKPFKISVYENSDFSTYLALRKWFDEISNNANQAGGPGSTGRAIRMNYYNQIVADITLTKLENPNKSIVTPNNVDLNSHYKKPIKLTLINAYPVNISEVILASDISDRPTSFDASFTYESYTLSNEKEKILTL